MKKMLLICSVALVGGLRAAQPSSPKVFDKPYRQGAGLAFTGLVTAGSAVGVLRSAIALRPFAAASAFATMAVGGVGLLIVEGCSSEPMVVTGKNFPGYAAQAQKNHPELLPTDPHLAHRGIVDEIQEVTCTAIESGAKKAVELYDSAREFINEVRDR